MRGLRRTEGVRLGSEIVERVDGKLMLLISPIEPLRLIEVDTIS